VKKKKKKKKGKEDRDKEFGPSCRPRIFGREGKEKGKKG